MVNSNKDALLKEKIEEYIKDKGWPGFFGLLATISPNKVDKEDLAKLEEELTQRDNEASLPTTVQIDNNNEFSQNASIYAEEHIPAVQDDAREQGMILEPKETPKTKILEPPKNPTQGVWADTEVVEPGQLKL